MTAIGNSQHRVPRHKLFLAGLCDERAGSVDEGEARGFIYLDFSKGFGTAFHSILIAKVVRYKLDKWASRKIGQTARLKRRFWGTKSNWQTVSSAIPQDQYCPY